MPLLEFINNYGSVASQKKPEARTDQNEWRGQIINQSEQSSSNKLKSKEQSKQTQFITTTSKYSRYKQTQRRTNRRRNINGYSTNRTN